MKGTLHKTESGWQVSYYIMRESSHAIHPNEYTLPILDYGYVNGPGLSDSNEGLEVEFEIIDFPSNSISKYAKLVDKATRPLTENDAYRTRADQKNKTTINKKNLIIYVLSGITLISFIGALSSTPAFLAIASYWLGKITQREIKKQRDE